MCVYIYIYICTGPYIHIHIHAPTHIYSYVIYTYHGSRRGLVPNISSHPSIAQYSSV